MKTAAFFLFIIRSSLMRTKDILVNGFEDIKILLQYLYMNKNHTITVSNDIVLLELSLTENMTLMCKNTAFPELPATPRDLVLEEMLGCVEQLKEIAAEEFPDRFPNRWEEIKTITKGTVATNRS